MSSRLLARSYPCARCPFRRDVSPGEFSVERYERLKECSVGASGREVGLDGKLFACHKGELGEERICAGWLAVAGWDHLRVRVLVLQGQISPAALTPHDDWPVLFETYDEMAETQGG